MVGRSSDSEWMEGELSGFSDVGEDDNKETEDVGDNDGKAESDGVWDLDTFVMVPDRSRVLALVENRPLGFWS